MKYLYLLSAVAFNVASYLLHKSIANKQSSLLWYAMFTVCLILGGVNVYFSAKSLKDISLSIACPVFSAACILLMTGLSFLLFDEKLSVANMAGTVFIVVGIALMSY
jgi:multidrug transporter EmrE-like cation transporter